MKKILLLPSLAAMFLFACTKESADNDVAPSYPSVSTDYQSSNMDSGAHGGNGYDCNNSYDLSNEAQLVVAFRVDNEGPTVDEKMDLMLTNLSQNAVSYEWDFGDGEKSSEQVPTHAYDIHGDYTIKLKATDRLGNAKTFSQTVTVLCTIDGGLHEY
jgi:PKD repeat protein